MHKPSKSIVVIVEDSKGKQTYMDHVLEGDYIICGYEDEGSTDGDIMRRIIVNDKDSRIFKVNELTDELSHIVQDDRELINAYTSKRNLLKKNESIENTWLIHDLDAKINAFEGEIKKAEEARVRLVDRAKGFSAASKIFHYE